MILYLTLLFWIILDSLGNVPLFVNVLRHLDPAKQRIVILREMIIALAIIVFFLFFGEAFFRALDVDLHSLEITGGIILFLIAIQMIFALPLSEEKESTPSHKEPLIVPLAVPAVAGPAILATVVLYGGGEVSKGVVLVAICLAWAASLPILLLAPLLKHYLGANGTTAIERIFGYIIALIATQMTLQGIVESFHA